MVMENVLIKMFVFVMLILVPLIAVVHQILNVELVNVLMGVVNVPMEYLDQIVVSLLLEEVHVQLTVKVCVVGLILANVKKVGSENFVIFQFAILLVSMEIVLVQTYVNVKLVGYSKGFLLFGLVKIVQNTRVLVSSMTMIMFALEEELVQIGTCVYVILHYIHMKLFVRESIVITPKKMQMNIVDILMDIATVVQVLGLIIVDVMLGIRQC
jgi:hypothetical protein